jgi:hypothetical protein
MKSDLSPRDWQEISSYLDHQLSVEAQARLEERMRSEQALQDAFDDLYRTRALLRSQPRLRAPRNFTLTREIVGKRSRTPAYPALGLVSALASLLFIVLLVGDLLNQQTALAPAQITNGLQAEVTQFKEASPNIPGALDAGEAAQAPALEAAPMAAPAAAPTEEAPSPAAKVMAPQPTPSETVIPPPAELPEAVQPSAEQAQNFAAPAPREQESGEQSPEKKTSSVMAPKIFGLNEDFWHALEITAAVLAVTTGIAWWLRRRRL